MGVLHSLKHDRPVLPVEMMLAHGYPVHDLSEAAAAGTSCMFSRRFPAPSGRTYASMAKQLGNGMHVNTVGAMSFVVALTLPELGLK